MQTEKVDAAQQKLNEVTAKYGKDSTQAQQAAGAYAQALRGLAFEKREATAQAHNMLFMEAMIASEILALLFLLYSNTRSQSLRLRRLLLHYNQVFKRFHKHSIRLVQDFKP